MLRIGMKYKTDKQMPRRKNTEPEPQTEVDNGVHPLHWATSLGPSPMGTDPINGFKNGTNGSGLCKSISAVWTKVCKTSSLD